MPRSNSGSIALIGAGRAARGLGLACVAARVPVVAVWSRRGSRARALARVLASKSGSGSRWPPALAQASVVLICVPDDAVAAVAASLAHFVGPRAVVAHVSGALAASVLRVAGVQGPVGSFHPAMTFADPATAARAVAAGGAIAIEGDTVAVARLRRLARALGARPFVVPAGGKALYHAACVAASNYVVAVAELARALGAEAGLARPLEVLVPLMRAAVDAVDALGPRAALTGPIARGDVATVAAHLAALAPEARELYAALGRRALTLAPANPALSRLLASRRK